MLNTEGSVGPGSSILLSQLYPPDLQGHNALQGGGCTKSVVVEQVEGLLGEEAGSCE